MNAEDYESLSQWRRLKLLCRDLFSPTRPRWPFHLSIALTVWPLRDWWRFGIETSQEFEYIKLGPFFITIRC